MERYIQETLNPNRPQGEGEISHELEDLFNVSFSD